MKQLARIPALVLAVALLALLQLHPARAAGPSPFVGTIAIADTSFAGDTHAATEKPATASDEGQAANLFGMDTEPLVEGEVLKKWSRARAGIAHDRDIVDRCRADGECPAVAQRLIELSEEGAGRESRAKVGFINRAVDLAITPASDEAQWRATDHWSAPLETLQSGRGDCEDYAIVKYAALPRPAYPKVT